MPRFTTLYSGSSGNCGVIEHNGRYLLVDLGASCKTTVNALAALGLAPGGLCGILVTHEHSDHIRGLQVFLKRHPVPVFASAATLEALWQMNAVPEATEMVAMENRPEDIEGFLVNAFPTSHDAAGCCGFRVAAPAGEVMAIATDLGEIDAVVYNQLKGADLVALEANYDPEMLRTGRYPYVLKKRIASRMGHLPNGESASTVASLVAGGCRRVALCHLSQENNHPNLVRQALDEALFAAGMRQPDGCRVQIANRYEVSEWMDF